MSTIVLNVNGRTHTLDIDPSTPLLYILRNDLGLQGPRFGCGLGQYGACTVIINGAATRSCIVPASAVKGEITTLEGLAKDGKLHPLQQAWIDEQVPQCRFCQNGQIMTAKALLDRNPRPTGCAQSCGRVSYRACLGIIRLANQYTPARMVIRPLHAARATPTR
jgi:aerobic-type carbon monoxide dehydrogenase small subunit (CoxS/CutS family)